MTRIKRGVSASKRRKKVLKLAKGFRWRRKTNYRAAKEAVIKAGSYAYRDRRTKKRVARRLWIVRMNNALELSGIKYSRFVRLLKEKKIEMDRKVLSQLAQENLTLFQKLIEKVK